MDRCLCNQEGEVGLHRHMRAAPDPCLKAIAPYREDRGVGVAGLFTWDGLADLCTQAGMPVVLGHALSMPAIPGGKATHDTIDAHQIAVLRRGGLLPQASGSPAERRATSALLRRRRPLTRKRAELLAHRHTTNSQHHLPEIGKTLADKANRDGVADRVADPAGQQRIAVARAWIGHYDGRRTDVARALVQTAKAQEAQTC